MPADVRISLTVFIQESRRSEQDVWTHELFKIVEQTRMCAQIERPLKEKMQAVKPRHAIADCLTGSIELGAVVIYFRIGQDWERVKKSQFFVVRQLLVSKDWTSHLLFLQRGAQCTIFLPQRGTKVEGSGAPVKKYICAFGAFLWLTLSLQLRAALLNTLETQSANHCRPCADDETT